MPWKDTYFLTAPGCLKEVGFSLVFLEGVLRGFGGYWEGCGLSFRH